MSLLPPHRVGAVTRPSLRGKHLRQPARSCQGPPGWGAGLALRTARPLRLARAGGAGTILLSDWGKAFELKKPDKDEVVDYGQQLPSS